MEALGEVRDQAAVAKLFDVLAPRYKDRQGGYTRVPESRLPLWRRRRDGRHRAG
jgi:ribosomal protein L17